MVGQGSTNPPSGQLLPVDPTPPTHDLDYQLPAHELDDNPNIENLLYTRISKSELAKLRKDAAIGRAIKKTYIEKVSYDGTWSTPSWNCHDACTKICA